MICGCCLCHSQLLCCAPYVFAHYLFMVPSNVGTRYLSHVYHEIVVRGTAHPSSSANMIDCNKCRVFPRTQCHLRGSMQSPSSTYDFPHVFTVLNSKGFSIIGPANNHGLILPYLWLLPRSYTLFSYEQKHSFRYICPS